MTEYPIPLPCEYTFRIISHIIKCYNDSIINELIVYRFMMSVEIETRTFQVFITEVVSNKEISTLTLENMKFLIDKSIVKLFGVLIAHKISYKLTMSDKTNIFEIAFHKKNKDELLTALAMISDLEYKIRIKYLTNTNLESNNKMDTSD